MRRLPKSPTEEFSIHEKHDAGTPAFVARFPITDCAAIPNDRQEPETPEAPVCRVRYARHRGPDSKSSTRDASAVESVEENPDRRAPGGGATRPVPSRKDAKVSIADPPRSARLGAGCVQKFVDQTLLGNGSCWRTVRRTPPRPSRPAGASATETEAL